jgi:cytochrome P450
VNGMAIGAEITIEALEADPYPTYARLRAEAPVCFVPATQMWLVTRWADVMELATDPETYPHDQPGGPVERTFGKPNVLDSDGEVHDELRKAIDPKFRSAEVKTYIDDMCRPIAEACLDAIVGRGEAEIMADYFEPISVTSLGQVMGLAEFGSDTLRRWFADLALGGVNVEGDPVKDAIANRTSREIDERLAPVIRRLETNPDSSALSHMIHAGMPAGQIRPREMLMPSIRILLTGGMQEPGHGAGSTLLGLLTEREQLAEVAAQPSKLVGAAVTEGLRWMTPIGIILRRSAGDATLAGVTIPKDALIAGCLASANRDESEFEVPDRFNIHRAPHRHLAFSAGPHFCSGAAFSRGVEGIALEVLLGRIPELRLDPVRPPVVTGFGFRAPRQLHVKWTA